MSLLKQKLFKWKEKPKILKTEWPELVGKDAEEATTVIDKEHPGLKIQIIPENSFVIKNLEEKRVRIFVDREQMVVRIPCIG
ncbi:subtilisin inhibitor-like [Orbicella faveolata]|uniref:subtilisin inhibitor-like n=1 Tax=Orbicella faveolata TaxID=48498 RepID=UPI0009E387AB|nr:subtilisin inhibitor-like [Orbicella faveolata]